MNMIVSPSSGLADIANIHNCSIALERAMSRSHSLPGLVCFYGPSGWGKSISAAWVANAQRAHYVQARSTWTRKHTLQAILQAIGVKPSGTIAEMSEQIAEDLALSGRPLIIDEMDHLVAHGSVELIRDIYESSNAAILLIGEEGLPSKLKRYERFHGRVLSWVQAAPVSMADARLLSPVYSPNVAIADDLLGHLVKLAHGSVRRVVVNLCLIQEQALLLGHDQMDHATWSKNRTKESGDLYTGEAPKRRLQ